MRYGSRITPKWLVGNLSRTIISSSWNKILQKDITNFYKAEVKETELEPFTLHISSGLTSLCVCQAVFKPACQISTICHGLFGSIWTINVPLGKRQRNTRLSRITNAMQSASVSDNLNRWCSRRLEIVRSTSAEVLGWSNPTYLLRRPEFPSPQSFP